MKYKKMTEKNLHKQICMYLKIQYPKILFNTDMAGSKLTLSQAIEAKSLRSNNGYPDIIIYEIGFHEGVRYALFLEIKKETPFKKNGLFKKNKHLENQQKMINELNNRGYLALFVWNFDMAKSIIDCYLKKN